MVEIGVNWWSWGLVFGRLVTERYQVTILVLGPFEFAWNKGPGVKGLQAGPKFWVWSPSRVFLFEVGKAERTRSFGLVLAWLPNDPLFRGVRLHVGPFVIQWKWIPAHIPVERDTMRERRRRQRAMELAELFTKALESLGQGGSDMSFPDGPPLDLRGNPNLN